MLIVELKGQRGPEELHWATQYGGHQSLASDCLGREPNQRESNQQQQLQLYTKQDKEQTFGPLRLPSLLVCSTVGLIILLGTTSLGAHARLDSYNTHKSEPVDPRNDLEYTKYTRKLIPPSNEQPSVGQPASIGRRRLRRAEAKPDGGPIITTSTTTTPKPSLPPTLPAVQTSIAPKHSTTLKPATTPTFHTTHTTNPSHVTSSTTRAPTTTLAPSSNHTTSKTTRLPLPPTDDGDEWEIDGKPQMLKDLLARLGEKGKKVFENIQSAFKDLNAVREMLPKVVAAKDGRYEARDVALFLDSHRSHALNDPRVHFTQQPMLSAAFKLQLDVVKVPAKLRFAYVLRSINELGRKIASRMSAYFVGMVRVLKKQPDGLGAKPELADYHEALLHAFNTDDEPSLTAADQQVKFPSSPAGAALGLDAFLSLLPGQQHQQQHLGAIGQLVGADEKKRTMLNRSLTDLSLGLAQTIITLLQTPSPNAALANKKAITVVGEALKNGAKTMVDLMKKNDKFKPEWEAVSHMNKILNKTIGAMWELTNHQNASKLFLAHSSQPNPLNLTGTINKLSAVKSGGLSDSTGLQGAWNSFLFDNLGTSERVVRVFAWLLGSFTETKAKTRFVNMYMAQVRAELAKTMSSFVALQAGPQLDLVASDQYLLADSNHTWSSSNSSGSSKSSPHPDYQLDKGRLPARCYLAGRRWRLLIIKATKHYDQQDDIISAFVDQIGQLKANYVNQPSMELERICLPRLEMGVKGWGINGEPAGDVNAAQNKFPLRNPIEGLNKDEDPFTGGARMGYRLGFMIGYNEKRNQSLEMEAGPRSSPIAFVVEVQKQHNYALNSTSTTMTTQSSNTINSSGANKTEEAKKKRDNEIDYLAKASYRQAITVGARKALEIGCREGYMATLRVSLRAGMLLPLEAGTSLASLKGANFASQAGAEAGRTFVNKYLIERDNMDDKVRGELLELGKLHGSLAGREIGETIGAIVGHEAALEAYRRAITRGGKITRAKFHLDEYLAGAMVGFDFGLAEGNRVAQSNNIDPSAPKFFKLTKPNFSAKISAAFGPAPTKDTKTTATTNKPDKGNSKQAPLQQSASPSNSTKTKDASPAPASRSALIELPASLPTTSVSSKASTNHWELELITPLTDKNIEDFHRTRNHTRVTGTFKGTYTVAKEIKKGLQRVSLANLTYNLEINALGFAMNDIAYLSLSGTINKANVLHGSLIATDIVKK